MPTFEFTNEVRGTAIYSIEAATLKQAIKIYVERMWFDTDGPDNEECSEVLSEVYDNNDGRFLAIGKIRDMVLEEETRRKVR